MEAAAAGLPLIVTKNGGPSESLRTCETEYGVLVDPRDPEDIAAGLLRVIEDQGAWQTFSELGRRRVMERYTWERTAESYLGQITTTIARPDARRPEDRLPIHPYLRGIGADEVTPDELRTLYFVWEREWG